MKKVIFALITALSLITFTADGQTGRKLKKVMQFEIPGEGGSNGASIAYDPVKKLYYAPIAGNAGFNLAIFNAAGKRVSGEDQETLFDVRGIWYNPATKKICANGYNDNGWMSYKVDAKGIPTEAEILFEGADHQPTDQSVGVFDAKANRVYFLNGAKIVGYNFKTGELDDKIDIMLVTPKLKDLKEGDERYDVLKDGIELPSGYNTTSPIFTGLPNAEIGLLNVDDKRVELYSKKTGKLSQKLILPDDAPCNESFNFGYANGIVWLFDKETRTWTGYK